MNRFIRTLLRPFKPILWRLFPSKFKYNTIGYWSKKEGPVYYDYWRKTYENNELYTKQRKILFDEIKKVKFNSLLEFGCGYGRNLFMIEKNMHEINLYGCDVSKDQISNAKIYLGDHSKCKLFVIDGKHIPCNDNEFDLVLCCDVLLHQTHDLIDIVRNEIFRVSKKYIMLFEGNFDETEVKADLLTDDQPGKTCYKHDHISFFMSKRCNLIRKTYVEELGNYILVFERQKFTV